MFLLYNFYNNKQILSNIFIVVFYNPAAVTEQFYSFKQMHLKMQIFSVIKIVSRIYCYKYRKIVTFMLHNCAIISNYNIHF